MAVTASQRLRSQKDNGNCMFYSSIIRYCASMIFPSSEMMFFSMVMGFPVALVRAIAMELQRGQPMELQMLGSFLVSLQMFL